MNIELESIIRSYLNWDMLSRYQKMSLSFMIKFNSYINWDLVLQYQRLDEKILRYFLSEFEKNKNNKIIINLTAMVQYQVLSEEFIIDYLDVLNIDLICKYQILPDIIINKNDLLLNLNWRIISKYQPINKIIKELDIDDTKRSPASINETFPTLNSWVKRYEPINEHIVMDEVIRRPLSKNIILSIFKNLNEKQKKIICKFQNLNNDILFEIDFSFYIDTILKYQRLSENILHDMIYFYDNIDFDMIQKYQKISDNFIQTYRSKFIVK